MKKVKLNMLTNREISISQQNQILGGYRACSCSCYYQSEPGGSSLQANCEGNYRIGVHGGHSIKGDDKFHTISSGGKYLD